MATEYDKGDTLRLRATFTDEGGVPIAPTGVTVKVKDGNGIVTTDAAPLADGATGKFRKDISLLVPGDWWWRWESTNPQTAEEGHFGVRPSVFA